MLPIVIAELANPLLGIEDALVNIVPVSFGKVRVLSPPVASAAVSIISFASAVDPSNIISPSVIFIELAAPSDDPAINSADTRAFNPTTVEAVAPSATFVLPIVRDELARLLLAIEDPVVNTVPELSGNVIVLSDVGSVTTRVDHYLHSFQLSISHILL